MRTRFAWLASLVLVAASAAADEVYRYTDENGRTVLTDSYYEIPEQYRDQVKDIAGETAEGPGRLSVIPGFMSPPKSAEGQGEKSKGKRGAKDAGFASDFQEGFAQGFSSVTGVAPSGVSPGLLIFGILLVFLVALAIGGGLIKTSCNIVGERPLLLGHAMLIVLIQGIAGALASGALNLTLAVVGDPSPTLTAIGALGGFVSTIAVNAGILKSMHCETWGSALKVTFTAMLLGVLMVVPFVYCAMR